MASLSPVDVGLKELLHDRERRHEFFKAIVQDEVAAQIRGLRKDRGLNQTQFADAAGMKQSAVSRIEQAEYSSWTLTTLLRAAAALDARWRMILEPCEEAIKEYENLELDAQAAVPAPVEVITIDDFGLTYTFPATAGSNMVLLGLGSNQGAFTMGAPQVALGVPSAWAGSPKNTERQRLLNKIKSLQESKERLEHRVRALEAYVESDDAGVVDQIPAHIADMQLHGSFR